MFCVKAMGTGGAAASSTATIIERVFPRATSAPSRPLGGSARGDAHRGGFLLGADARSQSIHQIDRTMRCRSLFWRLKCSPCLLSPQHLHKRGLVVVLEFRGIEMNGFAIDDLGSKILHLDRQCQVRHVLEICGLVSHLGWVSQRNRQQALVERFKHDDVLPTSKHHTRERNLSLFLDSVANDSEHFLADLVGWRDVIRLFQVPIVDLGPWHEAVDLDGVITLDPYLLQLIILYLDVSIAPDLIPATDVLLFDRLPGLGVDKLLLQPIAGFSADAAEGDALGVRRRRIQGNRTRHLRQFEIAFPIGSGGHGETLSTPTPSPIDIRSSIMHLVNQVVNKRACPLADSCTPDLLTALTVDIRKQEE